MAHDYPQNLNRYRTIRGDDRDPNIRILQKKVLGLFYRDTSLTSLFSHLRDRAGVAQRGRARRKMNPVPFAPFPPDGGGDD
jgi:hypothetical protein